MIRINMLLISTTLIISGCVGSTPKESPKDTPDVKPIISERCLVTNPTDFSMALVGTPGSSTKSTSLRVNFVVTAPTPGYKFTLKVKDVKESLPEQVTVDLMVVRPSGIMPQVLTQSRVNTMVMLNGFSVSKGSSVQVNCGGKPFFKIDKLTDS